MSLPMRIMAACTMVVLAGCTSSFGSRAPQRHYILEVPVAARPAAAIAARATTLLVMPATVSSFYDVEEIAYSRTPGTRAYYQLHQWIERPGPRMTELLVTHLDRAGSFRHVAKAASGVRGDLVLDTHVSEFFHDATSTPGHVRVTVTAELSDPVRRVFLARRTFVQSVPAPTYDAHGAVQAFNSAVAALFDDVSAWVDATVPR